MRGTVATFFVCEFQSLKTNVWHSPCSYWNCTILVMFIIGLNYMILALWKLCEIAAEFENMPFDASWWTFKGFSGILHLQWFNSWVGFQKYESWEDAECLNSMSSTMELLFCFVYLASIFDYIAVEDQLAGRAETPTFEASWWTLVSPPSYSPPLFRLFMEFSGIQYWQSS